MNSPSRPTPAHAHLSQTLAWLLAQQQNAELEASRLRECLDWLDSIVSDDADEHQEKASRAALAVEGQLVAANNRAVTAAQAAEALGFFHR